MPEVKQHTLRYVQQHSIGGVPKGVIAAPFDGYAEAWFADMAAVHAVVGSPKWAELVVEDDRKFLDPAKTLVLFTEEKIDYNA